jgi:hypothetical protein
LRHAHLETLRDDLQRSQARLPLPPFQVRQETPIHAKMHGQVRLRQPPLHAQLPQPLAEPDADVTPSTGHAPIMAVGFLLRVGHALHYILRFSLESVKRKSIVAIVFFGLGVLMTLAVVMRKTQTPRLGKAPEKVLPAQDLHFLSFNGVEFAQLHLGTDGSIYFDLGDLDQHPLLRYSITSDNEGLTLYSRAAGVDLMVIMEPEPVFHLQMPGGKYVREDAQQGWESRTSVALAKYAYHAIFPEKPQHTLSDTIPTEDFRLVDRNGSLFAVLGSTEAGEPSVVLVRPNGRLLMCFTITGPAGQPKQWPTVVAFDRHSAARIQVDLGPLPDPVFTIFEKCDPDDQKLEICRLDPTTGKETPKLHILAEGEGALPWLSHKMPQVVLPIILWDQRRQTVWQSSSPYEVDRGGSETQPVP